MLHPAAYMYNYLPIIAEGARFDATERNRVANASGTNTQKHATTQSQRKEWFPLASKA
jgi:hypothetical protein